MAAQNQSPRRRAARTIDRLLSQKFSNRRLDRMMRECCINAYGRKQTVLEFEEIWPDTLMVAILHRQTVPKVPRFHHCISWHELRTLYENRGNDENYRCIYACGEEVNWHQIHTDMRTYEHKVVLAYGMQKRQKEVLRSGTAEGKVTFFFKCPWLQQQKKKKRQRSQSPRRRSPGSRRSPPPPKRRRRVQPGTRQQKPPIIVI